MFLRLHFTGRMALKIHIYIYIYICLDLSGTVDPLPNVSTPQIATEGSSPSRALAVSNKRLDTGSGGKNCEGVGAKLSEDLGGPSWHSTGAFLGADMPVNSPVSKSSTGEKKLRLFASWFLNFRTLDLYLGHPHVCTHFGNKIEHFPISRPQDSLRMSFHSVTRNHSSARRCLSHLSLHQTDHSRLPEMWLQQLVGIC